MSDITFEMSSQVFYRHFYLENVLFLDIRVITDIDVVHHGGGAGDGINIDNFVQSNLKVRDLGDLDGELDGGGAGGVHAESHVMGSPIAGQRTQPFLITLGARRVGVGQLPAVIDQVVSQTEENWTITDVLNARLDFESADGV